MTILTGSEIWPELERRTSALKGEFRMLAFSFDYAPLADILVGRLQQGAKGRIIFDEKRFNVRSAVKQPEVLLSLLRARCEVRLVRREGHRHSSMHAKTLILDDEVAFTGSANYTYCGLLTNLEQVALVTYEPAVKQLSEVSEELWDQARNVGEEDLDWGSHDEPERVNSF